jgi:hypothetical protein
MGLSHISLSLASTLSHILLVVSFKQSVGDGCGMCGVVYLTPVAALPLAPADVSGGLKLACTGMAKVGTIVEIGTGSGV